MKPSQFNNFTGKRISSPEKEKSKSPNKRGETSQYIDLDGPELKVQVGDKTQVFKYGEGGEAEKPRLIDAYINYFQKQRDESREARQMSMERSRSQANSTLLKSPG